MTLAVASGCIRSTDDLPPIGEGGSVTGVVQTLSLETDDFEGVEGVAVRALGTGITATTDERGFFQLNRLPLGRVSVWLEQRDETDTVTAARLLNPAVVQVDGQVIDFNEIQLADLGSIAGRAGLKTEESAPIVRTGGTLIVAAQTAFKAITGDAGTYRLPRLPEGRLDIIAFETGFAPARAPGIEIRPNVETQVEELVLERLPDEQPFPIEGSVALRDAEDASGVSVELLREADPTSPLGTFTTGSDGLFSIEAPAGAYVLRFRRDGYTPVEVRSVAALRRGVVVGLGPVLLLPSSAEDTDADGVPDAEDPDRDNDGCSNEVDAFPSDPLGCADTDGDGVPDRLDADDDNDTLSDIEEVSPGLDGFETDPLNVDTDGDGFLDAVDVCPTIRDPDQSGRACTETIDPLPTPFVSSFSPQRGGVGTTVSIDGRNFSPQVAPFHTVRFGPGGAVAAPTRVTDSLILVDVPFGAQTGTIAVLVGDRVAASSSIFTFLSPPEVVRIIPGESRPGGRVVVFGREFGQPNLRLTINEQDVPLDACAPGEADNAQNLEALCFDVPLGAASGRLVVVSENGPAQNQPRFVVLPGPFITEVQPNPTARGQTVLIRGGGFSPPGLSQEIRVRFAGSASAVAATLLDDTTLIAILPADSENGPFVVEHPAGNATSSFSVVVDSTTPAILGSNLTLIQPGDTLVISGLQLEETTLIRFGGATSATPDAATSGSVTVIVPNDVAPGPATLEFVGHNPLTTTFRFSVLETDPAVLVDAVDQDSGNVGQGWSYVGDNLYVAIGGNAPYVVVLDDASFEASQTFAIGGLPPGSTALRLSVHPRLPFGVIRASATQTTRNYIVDIPSFAPLGVCDLAEAGFVTPASMHPTLPLAFSEITGLQGDGPLPESGIIRFDLQDGACDVLASSTANRYAETEFFSEDLLVYDSVRGLGLMNVDPSDNTPDGEFIIPISTPINQKDQLFVSLAGGVYALGEITSLEKLIFPPTGQPSIPIAVTGGRGILSSNRRWLFVGPRFANGGDGYFVDLLADRIARDGMPNLDGRFLASHPTLTRFVVGADTGQPGTWATRFTIRE